MRVNIFVIISAIFILGLNNKMKDKITIKGYNQFAKKNTFSDGKNN